MTHTIPRGPARAGGLVYALELDRMGRFYTAVLGLTELHRSPEVVVLASADFQLLLHAIPAPIAAGIVIETPPRRREQTAVKLFFTVPSLAQAEADALALGGRLDAERWAGPGFIVCNAVDPEGNVFQLREAQPPAR